VDLLAQIEALERAVAELLARVGTTGVPEATMRRVAADALVAWMGERGYTAADLLTPAAQAEMADALRDALSGYTDDLHRAIAAAVQENAERVERFYTARGVDVTDLRLAAARSDEAARLTEAFDGAMRNIRVGLYQDTAEAVTEAVLMQRVDSEAIRTLLEQKVANVAAARAQTMAAVGAFNQVHRLALADKANLSHFLYSGTIKHNTRAFCRACLDRVFRRDQIDQLKNGLLEPVMIYKGGWRCRHSWLPVNPDWDPKLAAKLIRDDELPREVELNKSGTRTMIVFAGLLAVSRINRQVVLDNRGYVEYKDDETNPTGFVAYHQSFIDAQIEHKDNPNELDKLQRSVAAAEALARLGYETRLDLTPRNRVGGDVDVIARGGLLGDEDVNLEVKQPATAHSESWINVIRGKKRGADKVYQSFDYLIYQTVEFQSDEELRLAEGRVKAWLRRRRVAEPDATYRVLILHDYEQTFLIEQLADDHE